MAKHVCQWCGENKSSLDFPRSNAMWFDYGIANVCTDCLEKRIDSKDLHSVDKILQFLDIPFYVDDWIDLYEDNGEHTLRVYVTKFFNRKDDSKQVDWSSLNEVWLSRQKNGTMDQHVAMLNKEWLKEMATKWGASYTSEDYVVLENLFNDIERTQNMVTAIQREQAMNICRLALIAREKIEHGEDASKELKASNDLIKAGGFEPKNARSYGEFESIGELINFLVKKGYKPTFYDNKDRDIVDLTIHNQQAFLQRLVNNEPSLPDMVQNRRDSYKIAQQLEEEGMDEPTLEAYSDEGFAAEFEGEDDFAEGLNDE